MAVPPLAVIYHKKVFPIIPLPVTEQAGVFGPHCILLLAKGVTGEGLIVTALLVKLLEQVVNTFVAVTV